jgi:ethanolaminephosphotransferase
MLISGYYGPQVWHEPIANFLGHPEIFGESTTIDLWIPIILFSFFVAHLPACIRNVVRARRKQGLPVAPVFLNWTPMLIYTCGCSAWLGSPYSTLLREKRLVLFCLTMSFVFGRMTTKMILAHLTKQPFPYWTVMLLPLIGGTVLANLPLCGFEPVSARVELWYLRGYFVFALIAYFRWAVIVISSICAYLDINCFTITDRLAPGQQKERVKVEANGKPEHMKRKVQ